MRASNILDLYKYEDAIETAAKALMTTNSITSYRQRDTTTVATPYVAIQFTPGEDMKHWHLFTDGSKRSDTFKGNITFSVVTDRGVNATSHVTLQSTVRNIVDGFQENINALLSYHAILEVTDSVTSPTVQSEDNQDQSAINCGLQFCIRTDAWPNAFTPTN